MSNLTWLFLHIMSIDINIRMKSSLRVFVVLLSMVGLSSPVCEFSLLRVARDRSGLLLGSGLGYINYIYLGYINSANN